MKRYLSDNSSPSNLFAWKDLQKNIIIEFSSHLRILCLQTIFFRNHPQYSRQKHKNVCQWHAQNEKMNFLFFGLCGCFKYRLIIMLENISPLKGFIFLCKWIFQHFPLTLPYYNIIAISTIYHSLKNLRFYSICSMLLCAQIYLFGLCVYGFYVYHFLLFVFLFLAK